MLIFRWQQSSANLMGCHLCVLFTFRAGIKSHARNRHHPNLAKCGLLGAPRLGLPYGGPTLPFGKTLFLHHFLLTPA